MGKCISGCLGKKTRILLADGSEKEISSLLIGDVVLLSNGSHSRIIDIMTGMETMILEIETKSGIIVQMTEGHPILGNNGWNAAKKLRCGEIVYTKNGINTISRIQLINYYDNVYNLMLEENNCSIFANGIVVGDFNMQNSLF